MTSSIATNILAGVTCSLSMVPEALAFTVVAGVPPIVGLHSAAVMAAVAAVFGAQPGVISGAAGATAVVLAPLTAAYGVEYLYAAVLLAGIFQVLAGVARLGKFIRLVPQPVMLGFINGLALVIAVTQLESFKVNGAWLTGAPLHTMLGLTAVTMAIVTLWPRITKAVPAPLVAISAVTAAVSTLGIPTQTVGDLATISGGLPAFHVPAVPLSLETLRRIAPVALSVAAVGLIEALLSQQMVDELTDTRTETHVECIGQGAAQVASGLLGGMGGCAMIGQSIINVNVGGSTRISGLSAAAALLLFVCAGSRLIESVPLAALTGVMLCLVIDIFDFTSVRRINQVPRTDAAVLIMATIVTYATNLAVAVVAGVVLASLSFAWNSALRGVSTTRNYDEVTRTLTYHLRGPLFFGSIQSFKDVLRGPTGLPGGTLEAAGIEVVVLDFLDCRVWDSSALEVINDEVARLQDSHGVRVRLQHLSADCRKLLTLAEDWIELEVMPNDPKYGLLADCTALPQPNRAP